MDSDAERKIRDLVKGCRGCETVLERSGGSFTFEIDVKAEDEGWSTQNKRPAKAGTRKEVDDVACAPSYYDALREHEYEELQRTPCVFFFRRQ